MFHCNSSALDHSGNPHTMKPIVIDIHAHFTPKILLEQFDAHAAKLPGVKVAREGKSATFQFPGTAPTRPVMPRLSDLDDRRAWMDMRI